MYSRRKYRAQKHDKKSSRKMRSSKRNSKSHPRTSKTRNNLSSIKSPRVSPKHQSNSFRTKAYPLRYVSLFSGIGGFEVGIHKIFPNAECMGFSEINPNAIKVYKEHFPDHLELGDVRHITKEQLKPLIGTIDLLVGGSPCQNFSQAGDKTGLKGKKSSLLHEFIRIKDVLQPTYFLLENVLMSSKHQKEVSDLLEVDPVMINSGIVSYQQRKRLYWCNFDISRLANLPSLSGTMKNVLLPKNDPRVKMLPHKDLSRKRSYGSMDKRIKSIIRGKPISQSNWFKVIKYSDKSMRTILKGDACYEWVIIKGEKLRQIHPIERERLQTFDDDWTSALSRTARYEVLGDAVTCDVIALIISQLKYK